MLSVGVVASVGSGRRCGRLWRGGDGAGGRAGQPPSQAAASDARGERTLFVRICRREGPSECRVCAQLPPPNANARAQHWQDAGEKFPLSDLNCSRF